VPLIVSWPTPNSILFGTPLSGNQLDATASIPGTFTYSPTNGTILPLGTNTLSVVFTPADSSDYLVTTNYTTITVVPVISGYSSVVFLDSESGDPWDGSDETALNTVFGTNW